MSIYKSYDRLEVARKRMKMFFCDDLEYFEYSLSLLIGTDMQELICNSLLFELQKEIQRKIDENSSSN